MSSFKLLGLLLAVMVVAHYARADEEMQAGEARHRLAATDDQELWYKKWHDHTGGYMKGGYGHEGGEDNGHHKGRYGHLKGGDEKHHQKGGDDDKDHHKGRYGHMKGGDDKHHHKGGGYDHEHGMDHKPGHGGYGPGGPH